MAQSPTVDGEVLPVSLTGEESPSLLAAATIALTLTATATDVSAQWRRRGWGWGPGVAAGVIGGVVITGHPSLSTTLQAGVVGYTGRPVQVCPCYVAPPPPASPPVKMIG